MPDDARCIDCGPIQAPENASVTLADIGLARMAACEGLGASHT